jgi:hypothetical protein
VNVYQMWLENGNRAGFVIERDSWGNWRAIVRSIGGQVEGKLGGRAPYYGNPEVIVDVFDRSSGEVLKAAFPLSCPGTYAYSLVSLSEGVPWEERAL